MPPEEDSHPVRLPRGDLRLDHRGGPVEASSPPQIAPAFRRSAEFSQTGRSEGEPVAASCRVMPQLWQPARELGRALEGAVARRGQDLERGEPAIVVLCLATSTFWQPCGNGRRGAEFAHGHRFDGNGGA